MAPQLHSSLMAALWVNVDMRWRGSRFLQAWIHGCFSQFTVSRCHLAARRSLKHDVFEVFLQDGVLDGVKDKTDIFCVYSGGEVVEERLAPVSPLTAEQLHQERLERAEHIQFGLNLLFNTSFVRETLF